ncbi:hypothetical protein L195_g039740 [Trifolium pratense]|uniref:Secreted protein n=1 Tax=Trifolium pratense TaxID=57577 RepID=A0A2K3LYT9_TRIPR|nr:hypothetical protein L195_g039740 [Trifolium pratense]
MTAKRIQVVTLLLLQWHLTSSPMVISITCVLQRKNEATLKMFGVYQPVMIAQTQMILDLDFVGQVGIRHKPVQGVIVGSEIVFESHVAKVPGL